MNNTREISDDLAPQIRESWTRAQQYWSRFLLLSDPVDDQQNASVGRIDLATRQVSLNFKLIQDKALTGSIEAILAHQIGHHVRYPASLTVLARLQLLEQSLIPLKDYSITNLFTDLMINERLGSEFKLPLIQVYQAFIDDTAFFNQSKLKNNVVALSRSSEDLIWKRDPAFLFYLAIYEELWQLKPGSLMGKGCIDFHNNYEGYRAEAQILSLNLFNLGPNLYSQFLYFASVLTRYLKPQIGNAVVNINPYECSCGEPSPDDWASALIPDAKEKEALVRALDEGWVKDDQRKRLKEAGKIEHRISGLPGYNGRNPEKIPEIMAAYYRQVAEQFLLRSPRQRLMGEAIVPTTLEEWEMGDSVREVDWLATFLERGEALGSAKPLKRSKIGEVQGHDISLWQPRMEIYLDVSGSMPNPCIAQNAMTLAAQILVVGTIRAGGWVRALLYSGTSLSHWTWCRSEIELSRFLMQYIGSGTEFPFPILDRSVSEPMECKPIRVVVTDSDFDDNYNSKPEHARIFRRAVEESAVFVLLLHGPKMKSVKLYRSIGARVIEVETVADYPKMAADLTFALFPDENHGSA